MAEIFTDNLWFKDAVIYELHIKAFRDGDGDGIGDFQGLLERLDYLKDLGATAIWVLPFYPSPLRDDGYDISDYYSINPSYGDLNTFKQVLDEAHKRDLKVITELVINHTSDQHPWFQRARKAPKGSVERDYYVWTDDPGKYKDVRIIFQDFESSNWTWDAVAQQYYWHRFFYHQPDLNYDNPEVQQEVFRIIDYWCNMGVDGFRLDAVPYLFERENTNGENLPETHDYLKKLRKHVDEHFPGRVFLAEANMWPEDSASYFGDGDECHMNYHFPVMPRMFMALQMEDRYPITDIFEQTPDIPETCQWAIFLRNHDELTLEMVTDEERDYMYKVYVKDPKARINLGIRHRLAPLMENNRNKIELMNVLLFSLSGTPVIYYGDEIGMGDNFYLGDRDGVRTPMQWSPDRNAGFSAANPQKLYLPLILDPEYHYEAVNVETQRKNPSSLFWFMKQLIQMRKKHAAFSRGNMKFVNVENPKVLAFTRTYKNETLLVIVNLSRYAQAAQLDLPDYKGYQPSELFSRNMFPLIREDGQYPVTIGPHGYYWLKLDKVINEVFDNSVLPEINLKQWQNLTDTFTIDQLVTGIIPLYLKKTKWFKEKNNPVFNVNFSNAVSFHLSVAEVTFILFDIIYETGVGDTFLLPAVFLENQAASKYIEQYPQAVVCRMKYGSSEGILYDAYYLPELQTELIGKMAADATISGNRQEIFFSSTNPLKKFVSENADPRPRILAVDDTNTSIGYDNKFFLKLYRHVDRTINPDVEITHFLTERVNLEQVPSFVGSMEWRSGKESIVLGMMQIMVEYHGNGRTYMLERLNNYYERITARESHPAFELKGTLTDPLPFSEMPEDLKEFIGGTVAEGIQLIGLRTGDMHIALASAGDIKDFAPEDFSLHYQRSLFAGLQSLVRGAFQNMRRNISRLSPDVQTQAEEVFLLKDILLKTLKKVYSKKLDVVKIRIHGNYDLKQIMFTGKDVAILDFHGDPTKSYSERRLKRSALVDIAAMIRSIHYTAHEGLVLHKNITREEQERMEPFAQMWTHYVTGMFMEAYLNRVIGTAFIPADKNDLKILLETFLLEKAIQSFRYELNNRPDWVIVPLKIIKSLLHQV